MSAMMHHFSGDLLAPASLEAFLVVAILAFCTKRSFTASYRLCRDLFGLAPAILLVCLATTPGGVGLVFSGPQDAVCVSELVAGLVYGAAGLVFSWRVIRLKGAAPHRLLGNVLSCVFGATLASEGSHLVWLYVMGDSVHDRRLIGLTASLAFLVVWLPWLVGLNRYLVHQPRACQRCHHTLVGDMSGICPDCGVRITHDRA